MKREDIDASHVMVDNDFDDDRHCLETCKTCSLTHCYLCKTGEGMDDDELAVPCLGFNRWNSYEVTGVDEITRTVKRSGTGWF